MTTASSSFLFDGKATYLLSDQDKSREFAGKKVAVVGTLDSNTQTIQVNSMAAAEEVSPSV